MDKLRRALLLLIPLALAFFTASPAHASEDYGWLGLDAASDALPEPARQVLDAGTDGVGAVRSALGDLLRDLTDNVLRTAFRSALAASAAVLASSVICALAGELAPNRVRGVDAVNLAGAAAIAASAVGPFRSLMGEAASAAEGLSDLGAMLLPVMASVSAASGAAASGAAKYAASALFLSVLGTLARKLVIPLIYMFLAASLGQAAFGGGAGAAAKLIAKLIKHALTLTALAFSVYLGAVSLIASSADAVTVRLTKTAISTLLPVVGGMVADASDTLLSGIGVLRGALGAAGLVAAVCLGPVVKLLLSSALLRAAAMLSAPVAPKPLAELTDAIAEGYSLMLALTGVEAAMLAVSFLSAARAAGA